MQPDLSSRPTPRLAVAGGAGALLLALLLIYGPYVGAGFAKDDFAWIASSRVHAPSDVGALFATARTGFYRPLVHLTFAADDALFGLEPRGYGWTNALLLGAAVLGIGLLGRALGMPAGTALVAAGLWALNPHGINMGTLWISGRTSLLLVGLALLAAIAFERRRLFACAACSLLAVLAKEEAILLPAIFAAWALVDGRLAREERPGRATPRATIAGSVALATAPVLYLLLRSRTTAMTPGSAPEFYRPVLDPARLLRNVLEYADRAATFAAAAVLLACLLAFVRPRPVPAEQRWLWKGAAWTVGAFALTVFLPVRSNLYACFPSVGVALAAAALLGAAWRAASSSGRARMLVVAVLPLVAVPLYWRRNVRYVRDARFNSRVLAAVREAAPDVRAGAAVVLADEPPLLRAHRGFGTLFPEAVRLATDVPGAVGWIEPPVAGWEASGQRPPPPGARAVHLRVEGGLLRRE